MMGGLVKEKKSAEKSARLCTTEMESVIWSLLLWFLGNVFVRMIAN